MSFTATALDIRTLHAITWRYGTPRFEGQRLALLGSGGYSQVYAHPSSPAIVLKVYAPEMDFEGPDAFLRQERQTANACAQLCLGPRFFGTYVVNGVSIALKERVYGDTVAELIAKQRFGEVERTHMLQLVDRMAVAGVKAADARLSNVMIGHTYADPTCRAFCIDPHVLVPLPELPNFEAARTTLMDQYYTVRDSYGPTGYCNFAYPLRVLLDEGVEETTGTGPWYAPLRRFWREFSMSMADVHW